jgi:type I restriction enzyme R subunit
MNQGAAGRVRHLPLRRGRGGLPDLLRAAQTPKRRRSQGIECDAGQGHQSFQALQDDNEEEAELWRGKLHAFRNLYAFLSQVIPYQDSDLEKLFTYLKHLDLKLPKRKTGPGYQFDDEVQLGVLPAADDSSEALHQPGRGCTRDRLTGRARSAAAMVREEYVTLSRLIDHHQRALREKLSEADQLFFDQIAEAATAVDSILAPSREVNSRSGSSSSCSPDAGIAVHRAHGPQRGVVYRLHEQAGTSGCGFKMAGLPGL